MQKNTADVQLNLFLNHTESSLGQYFQECLGRSVVLVLTDNSTSMLSVRTRGGALRVRLHRMFVHAGLPVVDEIVSFLKNRRSAMPLFKSFVRANSEQLQTRLPRKVVARTAGTWHDLGEVYREINENYFEGKINAAITWGSRSPRSSVRKRTLGSYSGRSNTIRINPVLDKKTVPRYYVAYVVYHEMLHADMGTPLRGKRRSIHSREFKKRERLFEDYGRAVAWERGGG